MQRAVSYLWHLLGLEEGPKTPSSLPWSRVRLAMGGTGTEGPLGEQECPPEALGPAPAWILLGIPCFLLLILSVWIIRSHCTGRGSKQEDGSLWQGRPLEPEALIWQQFLPRIGQIQRSIRRLEARLEARGGVRPSGRMRTGRRWEVREQGGQQEVVLRDSRSRRRQLWLISNCGRVSLQSEPYLDLTL